jgi:hypothetical protein
MKNPATPILIALFFISATGHVFWIKDLNAQMNLLDACAKANNVYACHMVPQPTEAPRVEYRQAAILPPPVM